MSWCPHQPGLHPPGAGIQGRLARLRRAYVLGGLWLGLPWFLLWVPCMGMLFIAPFGADLLLHAPTVLACCLLSGLAGWLPAMSFWIWACKRPALARRLEFFAAGRSLNAAQQELESLPRFETEQPTPLFLVPHPSPGQEIPCLAFPSSAC